MILLAFALTLAGFTAFGLATDRHHRARLSGSCPADRARRMQNVGWACLALALLPSIAHWGLTFGPIAWSAATMLSAAAVFLMLNLLPAGHLGRKRQTSRGARDAKSH